MEWMYFVLAVLFAISQIGFLRVFVVMAGIYWGEILIDNFFRRELQPEPDKSVDGGKVSSKVKEPEQIPVKELLETLQINPESLKLQTQETIFIINSLPDENPADDKKLESPEPVSEPKPIPAEVSPFNEQPETDEKMPESLTEIITRLPEPIIVETGNLINNDPVLEPESLEIVQETIIPENPDQVEENLPEAQSKNTDDNQSTNEPISRQSRLLTEREIADEANGLSKLMIPDECEGDSNSEKKPESLTAEITRLPENIVVETGNVANKDLVGETELLEIVQQTIIPEKPDQVEEQLQESKSTDGDNQSKDETINRESRLPLEREIVNDEVYPSSKLPDEQQEEDKGDESDDSSEPTNEEMDNIFLKMQDFLTANGYPMGNDINKTPKRFNIKVLKGVNLPEVKEPERYYISIQVSGGKPKKLKSKLVRGSNPEWNQNFTIKTQNQEDCLLTIKVKKWSKLGSKKSTIGSVQIYESVLLYTELDELPLFDENHISVEGAYLELDVKVEELPEVVPSPAEVKKQQRKLKAKMILCHRHGINPYAAQGSSEILIPNVPKPVSWTRKMNDFLATYQSLHHNY